MVTSVPIETEETRNSFQTEKIDLRLRRVASFSTLLAVLLAGAVFLALAKSNADPDLGWHLRNAQYQLSHHRFLRHDLYSFTTHGKPWMDHEWLAEIAFYLGWKWCGARGIFSVTYALLVIIMLGIYRLAAMQSSNAKAAFLVALAAIPLASVSFGPRTLLFGWLFLIVELEILYRFRNGYEYLWVLPPLFIVWVNMHGSWLIGLVLLVFFALSGCLNGRWGLIEATGWIAQQGRRLMAVITASALGLFINPYGWKLVAYPFDLAFRQKLNIANVMEWRTLDFHSPRGKLAITILMCAIVLQLVRRRRWVLHEVIFMLIGVYAGFTYSRFLFLTAILVIPFFGRDIGEWVPPYLPESDKLWLNAAIMIACMSAMWMKFPTDQQLLRAESIHYPVAAQNYLEHFHPQGNVLNDYLWGGYMVWHFPRIPVFIDSRVDVFERNGVFSDYLNVIALRDSLKILDKYKIRYALFENGIALSYLLKHTPGWAIDYQDKTTILFERKSLR